MQLVTRCKDGKEQHTGCTLAQGPAGWVPMGQCQLCGSPECSLLPDAQAATNGRQAAQLPGNQLSGVLPRQRQLQGSPGCSLLPDALTARNGRQAAHLPGNQLSGVLPRQRQLHGSPERSLHHHPVSGGQHLLTSQNLRGYDHTFQASSGLDREICVQCQAADATWAALFCVNVDQCLDSSQGSRFRGACLRFRQASLKASLKASQEVNWYPCKLASDKSQPPQH